MGWLWRGGIHNLRFFADWARLVYTFPMSTRILLVEDEPILVSLYTMALAQSTYDVHNAADVETAETKVVSVRPQVILLDLLLPNTPSGEMQVENFHEPSGFHILRLVKGTPSLESTRIIVLSNLDSDEHMSLANELGADRYIVKANLDPHDLKRTVEEVLHSTEAPKKMRKVKVADENKKS